MRKLLIAVGVMLYALLLIRMAKAEDLGLGPGESGRPKTVKVGKDSTRVTMNEWSTPILGHSPMRVRIIARIDKPTPDWFCPSVEVIWAEGTKAFRESDCEPLEEQEQPPKVWTSEEIIGWLGGGEHDIEVRLKQGKQELVVHLYATVY